MSETRDDGGQSYDDDARRNDQCGDTFVGMSLRDYFAAKAMHAFLREEYTNHQTGTPKRMPMYDVTDPDQSETVAFLAYTMADAMLAARKAGER